VRYDRGMARLILEFRFRIWDLLDIGVDLLQIDSLPETDLKKNHALSVVGKSKLRNLNSKTEMT